MIPTVENESENYEYGIVEENGTLEILPREITISAEDVEKHMMEKQQKRHIQFLD